jgi:hypothetical protein
VRLQPHPRCRVGPAGLSWVRLKPHPFVSGVRSARARGCLGADAIASRQRRSDERLQFGQDARVDRVRHGCLSPEELASRGGDSFGSGATELDRDDGIERMISAASNLSNISSTAAPFAVANSDTISFQPRKGFVKPFNAQC